MRNNDDFDEPNNAKAFGSIMNALDLRSKFEARKPVYASGIVIALVAVLGSVIWYSYPRESAQREVMNTPIVRADASDYRVAPAEPGGMAIPYRESTVFNTLRSEEGGEQTAKVENLLPQPERPVSRDELFAGLKVDEPVKAAQAEVEAAPGVTETPVAATTTTTTTTTATAAATPEVAPSAAPVTTTTTMAATTTAPVTTDITAPMQNTREATAMVVDAVKAAQTEPAAGTQVIEEKPVATSGKFYVQLGSVKDRDRAQAEWKKLQSSLTALAPLTMRVQEAKLGDKGTFYRIQGGPVTEAQAKSICQSVSAQRPGGCLVVRP